MHIKNCSLINFIGKKKKKRKQESKSKKKINFYINYELSFFSLTNEFLRKKSFEKEKKKTILYKSARIDFYVVNELEIIYFPIRNFAIYRGCTSFIITSIIYFISGLFQIFCITDNAILKFSINLSFIHFFLSMISNI